MSNIDLGDDPTGLPPDEAQKIQIQSILGVLPLAGGTMSEDAAITFANNSRLKEGTTDAGIGGVGGIAMVCSLDYEMKWEAGRLYIMGQDGFTIRVEMFSTIPDQFSDETKGYAVGSVRITDNGQAYICNDPTDSNAVWNQHSIVGSDVPTDNSLNARRNGSWEPFGEVMLINDLSGGRNHILTKTIPYLWTELQTFIDPFTVEVYEGVTIESGAFEGADLMSSCIINGYRSSIEQQTFMSCGALVNLSFSTGSIGDYACSDCVNLATVSIGDPTNIGFGAFENCSSLGSINLGSAVTNINNFAFKGCTDLADVVFPVGTLTLIDYQAFMNCTSLSMIVLPDSLQTIGEDAFNGCAITDLVLPANVETIGPYAFAGCPIETVSCYRLTPPATTASVFDTSIIATEIHVPVDADTSAWGSTFEGLTVVYDL
jgi:hypothetical protein